MRLFNTEARPGRLVRLPTPWRAPTLDAMLEASGASRNEVSRVAIDHARISIALALLFRSRPHGDARGAGRHGAPCTRVQETEQFVVVDRTLDFGTHTELGTAIYTVDAGRISDVRFLRTKARDDPTAAQ